jgi:hypothetical protein
MSDFFIHPVYLSARAAIVAPERAIPVTLYATQKWLPRLGPERWCLVILLRSLCLDLQRRSDGTKQVACSWRQLAEMLDVHEETIASWLKHKLIPNDKPWRCIIPVDEKAKTLALFIPRLRYAYETRNGKTRRTGFLLEILMEDPVAPEDEAQLRQQIEVLQLQQGELGLETHRLTKNVSGDDSDLLQLSPKTHKQQISSLHKVNQLDPDLPAQANSSQLGLHNASVNPDNSDLPSGVKQNNLGLDSYVNLSNEGSPGTKSEEFGKNVNELNILIQHLKQSNLRRNLRRDSFQPIIQLTETLLEDTHSKGMLFKVLNVLYPERLDLYVAAVRVALDVAQTEPHVNRGAVFVRTLRDLTDKAGIDLGFKQGPEERTDNDGDGNPGSQSIMTTSALLTPPSNGEALWAETQLTLRRQMTQATYDAIIQRTVLVGHDDNHYVIGVRTEMAKEWLENRLYDIVQRTLSSVVGSSVTIAFRVVELD